MRIQYPWIVGLVIGFNALLCLLVAFFIESPFNYIFFALSAIAALQVLGFATAHVKLDVEQLRLRHFFRTETIAKAAIERVDAANFRTVLVVLKNGETKQIPAFGLDSFRTAKTLRAWLKT